MPGFWSSGVCAIADSSAADSSVIPASVSGAASIVFSSLFSTIGSAALFRRQDDEEQILTNYMNYKVVHEEGEIGTVSNFYEMQEYDIIEVDMRGKLIMIPLHDETIISVDDNNKILKLKLPEGLLDVF